MRTRRITPSTAGSVFSRIVRFAGLFLLTSVVLGLPACDLLDVENNPKTVPADELNNPTSLPARLIGAEANFFFAYDMAIVYGGLFTDELIDATGFTQVAERRVTADNGAVGATDEAPEGIDGLWTPMQRAAAVTDQLQEDLLGDNFPDRVPDPSNSAELARISLFAGYTKLMLADAFCTLAFGGTGPELTSQETYALAADEFTLAIEAENATDEVRSAALVGRARARLQMGDEDGALADARQVPADFEYIADVYSNNSQTEENDLWNMMFDSQRFSVAEAYRNPPVDGTGAADPRVQTQLDPGNGVGSDGITPMWQALKYGSAISPIRLASGDEARYIIAEVVGGQEAVDVINAIRAEYGISEPFASMDAEAIQSKVREEKARTLFLEGQRMGDLRRYLERDGVDLFPTGPTFGDQTCMPLPNAERDNNPDI